MIDQKLDYLHNNPVKAGFVTEPECFTYSSARDYAGIKGCVTIELVECLKWHRFNDGHKSATREVRAKTCAI